MCGVIKVYDDIMGSGKTTKIIDEIYNSSYKQKFIYISPFLEECHRVAGTTYDLDDDKKLPIHATESEYAYSDDAKLTMREFKHPVYGHNGNKSDSLLSLLRDGANIVTTHQLFKNITSSMAVYLNDYILIIDEELSVNEVVLDYKTTEIDKLLNELGWLYKDVDGVTLRFNYERYNSNGITPEDTSYETLSNMCDFGQLLYVKNRLLMWELSKDVLKSFKEVWIASYMFEGSLMSSYLKVHGYEYELINCGGKRPSEFKSLINIIGEGKSMETLNKIGSKHNALSSAFYTGNKDFLCEELRKNMYTFFKSKTKSTSDDFIWTTFKPYKRAISGGKFSARWLPLNIKSTNEYQECHNIAYLINVYTHPFFEHVMNTRGHPPNNEIYALSTMIQFIWRSAIRKPIPEPINLYIPSKRMRDIFIRWLNDEFEHTRNIEN